MEIWTKKSYEMTQDEDSIFVEINSVFGYIIKELEEALLALEKGKASRLVLLHTIKKLQDKKNSLEVKKNGNKWR